MRASAVGACDPHIDCSRCVRLAAYRRENARLQPDWHNRPVSSLGASSATLLIVGLAPGLRGANRTGRPFTGDASGEALFGALIASGFARCDSSDLSRDRIELVDCFITNAVRCVPPANKPTADEAANCRPFLAATIGGLSRLSAILVLGRLAHDSTVRALGSKPANRPFAHGARHPFNAGLVLFDSYHCSRYNMNTGRMTPGMLSRVVESVRDHVSREVKS